MKYITLSTAKKYLDKFFPEYPRINELTLDEAYKAYGRSGKKSDSNKTWLTNVMTHLRHYGLAESRYSDDSPARFIGIRLTQEGRKALDGRLNTNGSDRKDVTLETIAKDIKEFERLNPSIKLDLGVKIREEIQPMEQ